MSWKIALLVAFLTAIITAVITAPVADHVTKAMKVSNMEGGRGYMVVFMILCGAVGGLVIGLIVTRLVGAVEWSQYWKAQGFALLASNGVLFGIAGLCLLSVPRQLLMQGQRIALDFELFLPNDLAPEQPSLSNLRLSLYAGQDDNHYVDLDTTRLERGATELLVPGQAGLNTVSPVRMLSLTVNDSMGYTLDLLLSPVPNEKDLAWTERLPMRLSKVTDTKYEYTRVMVRYRMVMQGKVNDEG